MPSSTPLLVAASTGEIPTSEGDAGVLGLPPPSTSTKWAEVDVEGERVEVAADLV